LTTIRPATPDDARAIAEVKVETWRAAYVGVMPQSVLDEMNVDAHARIWASYLGSERVGIFVAEAGGEVVGFASVGSHSGNDGAGELYAIYVRPGSWDTGTGLALMGAAVDWLTERFPDAVLWVAKENPRARRFYELYGWKPERERVAEVVPGAQVAEVLYRLVLLDRR
jgi:RimJ/RimL family protein N-acetyltransferase